MGCGSSGQVVGEYGHHGMANGHDVPNGVSGHHHDELPTVILPETPNKLKPPVAYEIPIEEFDGTQRSSTPPAHLQRLLQPPSAEISLPEIEEKLAEAEQRRLSILQQRAASAQKRAQRMTKSFIDTGNINKGTEEGKRTPNALTISPEPGLCEDKNI